MTNSSCPDLGLITPDVYGLRDQFQLPGMRILQFAFDGHADNPYLPHNYAPNTVVYTDNNTTRGWFEALPEDQKRNVWNYLKRPAGNSDEVAWELIHLAWSSSAALASSAIAGSAQLGSRGPNEPARKRGRQLAPALHRRNVVQTGLGSLARLDHVVEPPFMKVQEKDPKMVEGFTPDHVGAVAKQVLNRCQGKGRLNG